MITVVSGAGVSASAGISTYREFGSSWTDEQFEEHSHSSVYGNHLSYLKPKWYDMWLNMKNAEPTIFHKYVAEQGWNVITQNIDGLHQKAGSKNVLEIHGSISRWRRLKSKKTFSAAELTTDSKNDLCDPSGNSRIRPDVVLFGEMPMRIKEAKSLIQSSDVVIYAGTSGNVYPIADFYKFAKHSVLVDPVPWGSFDEFYHMTTDDWARKNRL